MKKKRDLKRLVAALLCAAAMLMAVTVPALAAEGEPLTVGVPEDRCPVFYRDADTGEAVGIGVDLMRWAAEDAGYDVRFRFTGEGSLKEALDNPEYDVVMPFGSAIASASGQASIVSENLLQTPFTLVTEGSREMPPLNELRVGMLRSLAAGSETVREMYPGMEITLYEDMPESVKALRTGEVDALLHNSYVWSYVLQKPAYADLAVQPSTMFSMDFRAGAPDTPAGRQIIQRLNESIGRIPDTRRQAIVLDYTSRSLYEYDFSDYLYKYGAFLLLGALLLAAIIIIAVQRMRALRREQEEKLRQLMDHDPLTGVLSMNGFRKRVEELLIAHPDSPYFLSYNNIRGFKFINDSLGRQAGDDLLRFWASISLAELSEDEAMGRITADHFVVLRRVMGQELMDADKRNVFERVQNYFLDQGKETRVQLCSGIYVLTPRDFRTIDVDHLVDLARVAEQRVRESREGDYAFYNPEQWERGKRIADVVNSLPTALLAGDIQVWYQPQVNYETGEILGAEALCRWNHATLGWLQPAGFIPTLEDAGLIYDLDSFVWEKVCQDLQRWNQEGRRLSVAVNVSRNDLGGDREIPEHFRHLVQAYDLTPDQLRIEITETAYAESPELLIRTTEQLRALGFQVEMDDFGSGYSSLHMLKEVPVDRIKLDLHFLSSSGDPEKSRIIISCMIQMVRQLGLELIVEGVETEEQANFLKSQGSLEMQGYFFHKPMPVQEFEQLG